MPIPTPDPGSFEINDAVGAAITLVNDTNGVVLLIAGLVIGMVFAGMIMRAMMSVDWKL